MARVFFHSHKKPSVDLAFRSTSREKKNNKNRSKKAAHFKIKLGWCHSEKHACKILPAADNWGCEKPHDVSIRPVQRSQRLDFIKCKMHINISVEDVCGLQIMNLRWGGRNDHVNTACNSQNSGEDTTQTPPSPPQTMTVCGGAGGLKGSCGCTCDSAVVVSKRNADWTWTWSMYFPSIVNTCMFFLLFSPSSLSKHHHTYSGPSTSPSRNLPWWHHSEYGTLSGYSEAGG